MPFPSLAGRVLAEPNPFTMRGACSAKPLVRPPFPPLPAGEEYGSSLREFYVKS